VNSVLLKCIFCAYNLICCLWGCAKKHGTLSIFFSFWTVPISLNLTSAGCGIRWVWCLRNLCCSTNQWRKIFCKYCMDVCGVKTRVIDSDIVNAWKYCTKKSDDVGVADESWMSRLVRSFPLLCCNYCTPDVYRRIPLLYVSLHYF